MGRRGQIRILCKTVCAAAAVALTAVPSANAATGDLLVAPTRLEISNFRGTEVVLNNIGTETATYRISLELRRMTPEGELVDVDPAQANAIESKAIDMIAYAPRRVVLPPNQPQAIRIGIRPPADLPDGEYRAHLLFRGIPTPKPATASEKPAEGISIEITAIYGVTIPVIVRAGQLSAKVGIANAALATVNGRPGVSFDLTRTGTRSVYGDIRIVKPGSGEPIVYARGVAVYPEIDHRTVRLNPVQGFTGALAGPAKIQFVERTDDGPGSVLAEADVVLR